MNNDTIGDFSKDQIRASTREYHAMLDEFLALTKAFPVKDGQSNAPYWHAQLPVSSSFIDLAGIPASIRRLCMQALIDRAHHLVGVRPAAQAGARVIAEIDLPSLSESGIIVMFDAGSFDELFGRNTQNSGWAELSACRSIEKEWVLSIPSGFSLKGFREELNDNGRTLTREFWFVGELG